MNYINRPKSAYTQEERIKYLEESIRELRIEKDEIRKEKWEIRQRLVKLEKAQAELSRVKENKELIKENKKLKEEREDRKRSLLNEWKMIQDIDEWNSLVEERNDLLEENKKLKKERDLYKARDEELNENCFWLAKENENLKSDLAFERTMLDNVRAEYKSLQNVNKKLKEENEEYKKMFETQLKDGYIKNTAEFLDKKFPKVNWFMEEDTLQELRDIGEI